MDLSNENVIHVKKDNIEYLQFRKLLKYGDKIKHAYVLGLDKNFRTARGEGNLITKEEYDLAVKSYKSICDELSLEYNNIVKANQTHSKNVKIINGKTLDNEPEFDIHKNIDGLITNKDDLILSTTNADCILLLFYDPVKNVVANVHSGWRGTLQRISVEAVKKMQQKFDCNPKDIICCICPSIRKCHFEVDRDVYELFEKEFQDLGNLENLNIIKKQNEKWFIDTVLINELILEKYGLIDENIIDSGICSVCNKELIHSYRAEGKGFGLGTAVIGII